MKVLPLNMPRIAYLFTLAFLTSFNLMAQEVNGTVADRFSQAKLEHVEVRNGTTAMKAYTDAKGRFNIKASAKDLLIFNQPGYLPDTLFLINLNPVKRYLNLNNNLLKIVEIKSGDFNPEKEYADVYRKANAIKLAPNHPFTFYPSKFFSKEGKYARRFKRNLEKEKIERKIDLRFNEAAVTALTPLKGKELDYFMVLYRPTLKELDKLDDEEMKFYLMNSFKEFKSLPPNKKVSPSLRLE